MGWRSQYPLRAVRHVVGPARFSAASVAARAMRPGPVGTVTGARALLLWVQPAGVGSLLVHRAPPRFRVEQMAVTIRPTRQREQCVLVVEVVNQPRLLQPSGDEAQLLMLCLERVHQPQPHQIGELYLQWHGAAVGRAGVAQARTVAGPGVQAVNVDDGDGGAHGFNCACAGGREMLVHFIPQSFV